MARGVSIRFKSYNETVPKLLGLLKLERELKKYDKIILKPFLTNATENSVSKEFLESVLKFILQHKNPVTEIFIAEGADGYDTEELYESLGYKKLAENYDVGLVDLNKADTEEVESSDFLKFSSINYPKILKDSFIISLTKLNEDEEIGFSGSLSNMLGAFPSSYYKGFFSTAKNKIRRWPIEYSIHDIIKCKMPNLAIVDASSQGAILAGLPLEIDKQSAKLLGKDWQAVPYLKLIEDSFPEKEQSLI